MTPFMNQGQFNNIPKDKEACGNELQTLTNSKLNQKTQFLVQKNQIN